MSFSDVTITQIAVRCINRLIRREGQKKKKTFRCCRGSHTEVGDLKLHPNEENKCSYTCRASPSVSDTISSNLASYPPHGRARGICKRKQQIRHPSAMGGLARHPQVILVELEEGSLGISSRSTVLERGTCRQRLPIENEDHQKSKRLAVTVPGLTPGASAFSPTPYPPASS